MDIAISKRAKPTDVEPTPEEQTVIDQLLAAMNTAVEKAETAVEHYPTIIDDEWCVWDAEHEEYIGTGVLAQGPQGPQGEKGDQGEPGEQGPKGETGDTGPIGPQGERGAKGDKGDKGDTGEQGPQGIQGEQGPKGDKGETGAQGPQGAAGQDGTDGTTFTPAVSADGIISWTNDGGKTNPQSVNIKGPQGETGATGVQGPKGDTGDAGVYVGTTAPTDTDVTIWIDPSGQGDDIPSEIEELKSGLNSKYEKPQTGIPASDLASGVIPTVPVQDVQVNGTSVLSNGVANVPAASSDTLGVSKVVASNGIEISSANELRIVRASDSHIKSGANGYRPIVSLNQHAAAFYGLAKAAGVDLANETVTLGTYTDAAKHAIHNMLGVEGKMRLLKTIDVTTPTTAIAFDTDVDNLPFQVDRFTFVAFCPTASDSKGMAVSIETLTPTFNGSYWIGKHSNAVSSANPTVVECEAIRTPSRWECRMKRFIASTSDLSTAVIATNMDEQHSYNGASSIRSNNPLYATQIGICLGSSIEFPEGTHAEFYAHDYEG